jgi:hypothetical protein
MARRAKGAGHEFIGLRFIFRDRYRTQQRSMGIVVFSQSDRISKRHAIF